MFRWMRDGEKEGERREERRGEVGRGRMRRESLVAGTEIELDFVAEFVAGG